ncbi:putative AP superfamily protein [Desulfitobacterium dehalogenans ATCC 51507]|uniref:Putative AP superfamily protein n=1 Tax=Desulfitobacterium dehalogenans (strain ATCC 51507 / DSM 9161 / JW/IU-DC1) TaxID=756499 RepID=I4AE33_DESDJ|nr:ectonucleotide pyrophosphatase/phosphodiesterase [Desulfitobacterium dehalogenans]AFM02218.1 putative AP superfamily protein [Desulfitobacterium dehalogenans ATCC 51507]
MDFQLKRSQQLAEHVIVVSYDSFSEENWEMAKSLPNLEKLLQSGTYSTKLRSVYPTLTYTVHTTIVTGVYPDKHGIFHNNPLQPFIPEKDQKWFGIREAIKAPTIYDAVKKNKMTAAGLLWPVSGKSSIKFNMPEVHATGGENLALKVLKNGSAFFCLGLELRYGRYRKRVEQPYLDDFTTLCAVDTIKRKIPNLLLLHLIELDDAKHKYGTDSKEVKDAIVRMDKRLGDIQRAVEEAGIQENTVILVVGDHGQLDVRYKVCLNNLLQEQGLIFEEKGKMQWRAYLQSAGGGAYLHIKEGDEEAEALAFAVLENALKEEQYGIEKIFYRNELDALHVDPSITAMVEAKRGYCFDDRLEVPTLLDLDAIKMKYATHGYLPDKENYRCNFIASGPGIKKNHPLGPLEMVDIAPTLGAILGVDFTHGDGRVLGEIFG